MTVGWIFEGDRDRFLAARDLTPEPSELPPSFRCPFCQLSFDNRESLGEHIQSSHAMSRPFLLIDGTEPGREDIIRTRIHCASLELFHCSELSASIDGDPLRKTSLASLLPSLSQMDRGTIRLQLSNHGDGGIEPVGYEYRLRFFVPDDGSLAAADELFLTDLGTKGVDLADVGRFYADTRNGPAAEYAEALADYVRAVLIKDGDKRTGVSGELSHYREVQNRALATLQAFNRPLARLVCGLLRFCLNDFSRWRETTGFPRLDHAYSLLGPIAQGNQRRAEPQCVLQHSGNVFECAVDDGTETVVGLAEQAVAWPRWGTAAERRFSVLAEQGSLDQLDRAKIRALWAAAALRLEALESARHAFQLLDGDPTFGRWAGLHLKGEEQQ